MGGSTPAMPAKIPAPPNMDNSQALLDAAQRDAQARSTRGRSSTVLNGGSGLSNMGTTSKTLLGT